jgi:hypothetical protein
MDLQAPGLDDTRTQLALNQSGRFTSQILKYTVYTPLSSGAPNSPDISLFVVTMGYGYNLLPSGLVDPQQLLATRVRNWLAGWEERSH